ncbi:MAG: 5-formyltetrahydrofolate cyclo-ligase [Dorea sp.]|nr:5-formyltetrahydrofolate cyclo-ligase [Dorea sp.]
METKREIRRRICQKRREMDEAIWRRLSESIAASVILHPWFLQAKELFTYVDYNGEAGTRKIIRTALGMGKNVWVPKVTGDTMHFYRIGSLDELTPGAYGIPEPACHSLMDGELGDQRLMLMPGVAFDRQCHRIGYGGGYYDRYLASYPADGSKLRVMALAFECQVLPEVPYEEYDRKPEIVVTEKRMIKAACGQC